ncbi:conserved hypothetical protein [Frankia sp. Hr75.2]|nr:conserved hypothetical protein [Frankia sp. Hr75.2]
MKKMILHVESRPTSSGVVEEFNRWYDEVHLPEIVAIDGFVSARRYAPVEENDPYIAQYEIEGDPDAVVARVVAASAEGRLDMSDAVQMDPRPRMRLMQLVTEYGPDAGDI